MDKEIQENKQNEAQNNKQEEVKYAVKENRWLTKENFEEGR
jgi:hypothetical protein